VHAIGCPTPAYWERPPTPTIRLRVTVSVSPSRIVERGSDVTGIGVSRHIAIDRAHIRCFDGPEPDRSRISRRLAEVRAVLRDVLDGSVESIESRLDSYYCTSSSIS
jgi:hypothetical protein